MPTSNNRPHLPLSSKDSQEQQQQRQQHLQQLVARLRPFLITYTLVHIPKILKILTAAGSGRGKSGVSASSRLRLILETFLKPSRSNLKLALFPSLFPLIYQSIYPTIASSLSSSSSTETTNGVNGVNDKDKDIRNYNPEFISILLTSPAVLLLPPGLRTYLALYALSSALSTFLKSAKPKPKSQEPFENQVEGENVKAAEKDWRDYLPPVTILNAFGNSWMAWSWFNEKGVFPKSYEKLILDHSPHYVDPTRDAFEIRDFLEMTHYPPLPLPSSSSSSTGHNWLACQTLHPNEPSCIKNYLVAWRDCAPIAAKWIAGFGALTTGVKFRGRVIKEPVAALLTWLDYLVRGTAYVTGSVQTLWAMVCLLQRVLPGNVIPKHRWFINGAVASLWVYVLPAKRQSEISIYVARLGVLSVWRAWIRHFKRWYVPKGEVLLLAMGWSGLVWLRGEGWKIEGMMRRGIEFVESGARADGRGGAGADAGVEQEEESGGKRGRGSERVDEERWGPKTVTSSASIADSGFGELSSGDESFVRIRSNGHNA